MTTRTEAGAGKSFVNTRLPWLVAAAAAIFYLLTLNHWLSFKNLQFFARATGKTWTPDLVSPVFSIVTSPFRWLPETFAPLALNAFSAVCSAVVLGLLARSVALLPHDRTHKQREREQSPSALLSIPIAWIPLLLAVAVCGLQLTFWENSTYSSSDIFDLVLFTYSVRCLLEYRLSHGESWLLRAAVVYVAGMTDTWVMVALFPAFLAAVIWMKGIGFFRLHFVARLFLCVLVGLLFYLYLPLAHLRSDGAFLEVLKANVGGEISQVLIVCRYAPRQVQFLLTLTSLLPILVIGIRWQSHFGDTSQFGTLLTTWIFHLTHAALLGVCIWAAFDTGFSLRDPEQKFPLLGYNRDKFLPLYVLSALSIGYLSGYFLLIFRPLASRAHRIPMPEKVLSHASLTVVSALLVLAPIGLLYKNVPQMKVSNGPAFQQFASALTENLPAHGVILSDNQGLLLLAQGWLARSGKVTNFVFLETQFLKIPAYHRFQKKLHPDIWPPLTPEMSRDDFNFHDLGVIDLLTRLSEKNPVYYLHSSFGAYFEYFYPVPHGLVYELKPYQTNTVISAPPLPESLFAENENFWKTCAPQFRQLLPVITQPTAAQNSSFRQKWMKRMHLPFEKNPVAYALGSIYSHALNTWGAQAERLGRLEAAGKHFEAARDLCPDNVVVADNLAFNKKLLAGERISVGTPESFEEHFGKYEGWQQTLNANGLFDEVTGCLAQGIVFARGNLNRQAAQQFERVLTLAPDSLLGRLWLARTYLVSHTPERALPLIDDLKAHSDSLSEATITPADIFRLELSAYYANQKSEDAERLLQRTLSRKPADTNALEAALEISSVYHQNTNALAIVEKQLELAPNAPGTLLNKGFIQLELGRFDEAIAPLTQVLSLQPTNFSAFIYRAYAHLQSDKLDEATHDYESARNINPKVYSVYYGFGEIALRKKDTNSAIHYYELALTNTAPNSPEAKGIANRLKSVKALSP